ncbi:MAG: inositol monophosphatase [Elusimicrobia bacterium]|nr:inositol monophosphatase [Candidatus Liberimonas magnetica]
MAEEARAAGFGIKSTTPSKYSTPMNYNTPKNLSPFTRTAIEAALAGGKILKKYFNKNIKVDYKGEIDPVTIADKKSQKAILEIIKQRFPGHTTLGEEDKEKAICSEYCWIIDPLDGTVNFIHGMEIFSVSIGLSHNGNIISGVVYAPRLKELFVAEKGKGAFLNGKRIRVSKINSLVRSLVVTGFPYYVHKSSKRVLKNFSGILTKVQGLRRLGSAAIDLSYVARGKYEAFWEEGLKPWDVAAGSLIVREAGGKVTDYANGKGYLLGENILATNGKTHKKMLKLIKR